jgi:hypothetical protein
MGAFVAGGAFEAIGAFLPGAAAESMETVVAGDIPKSLAA